MNVPPEYAPWVELAVALAIISTGMISVTLIAERLVASAAWRRTLWQAMAVGLFLVAVAEITGLGQGIGHLVVGLGMRSVSSLEEPSEVNASSSPRTHSVVPRLEAELDASVPFALPGPDANFLGTPAPALDQHDFFAEPSSPIERAAPARIENHIALDSAAVPTREWVPAMPTKRIDPDGRGDGSSYAVSAVYDRQAADRSVLWPAIVWSAGGVLLAIYVLTGHVMLFVFRRRCRVVHEMVVLQRVGRLARRLGVAAPVGVMESSQLTAPVAFGTFRPTIALPSGFSRDFEPVPQEAMLVHELVHLAARDPVWKLGVDLLCSVLWWQPAVWVLRHRLRTVSEAAADEASLMIPQGPQTLAACLVAMGRRLVDTPQLGWMPMTGDGYRSNLGRRVKRLLALEPRSWQAPRRIRAVLTKSLIVVVLVISTVSCTAWVRPQAALAEGESTMKQLKMSWSRSLAASTLAALVASASGDATADQPQITDDGSQGVLIALADDDDREQREPDEARRDRNRDDDEREARRDREREEADRHEHDADEHDEDQHHEAHDDGEEHREEILHNLNREREELKERAHELARELKELPDDADEEARGIKGELEEVANALRGVVREIKEIARDHREEEHDEAREEDEEHREEILHDLHRESEELAKHADELTRELTELSDDADDEAHAIKNRLKEVEQAARRVEQEIREISHDRRDKDHQAHVEEVLHDLMRERDELRQHGHNLKREMEELRRLGKMDRAREVAQELEHLERRHQEIEREGREIREGRHDSRPDPDDRELRLHHLRVAADNLHAAGMHDQAEHLMRQAEELAHGHGEQDRPPQPEEVVRAVHDLHGQMEEMRGQMEEMQRMLKMLMEREHERRR